jgi:hypothetical protein
LYRVVSDIHISKVRENTFSGFTLISVLLLIIANLRYIQPVPEPPAHRKQACTDSKRDSKMTKINLAVAHITEL